MDDGDNTGVRWNPDAEDIRVTEWGRSGWWLLWGTSSCYVSGGGAITFKGDDDKNAITTPESLLGGLGYPAYVLTKWDALIGFTFVSVLAASGVGRRRRGEETSKRRGTILLVDGGWRWRRQSINVDILRQELNWRTQLLLLLSSSAFPAIHSVNGSSTKGIQSVY